VQWRFRQQPNRLSKRILSYILLLSFLFLILPLSAGHHETSYLHAFTYSEHHDYHYIGTSNPPPWHKAFAQNLFRIFLSTGSDLTPQSIGAKLGESIPILLKHERLAPIKFTCNYVDTSLL
jgi:hypothetical protein